MPIRQADAPNQCSSSNKSVYKLLRYCCTCIALRVLRSLSHFLQLIRHSSRQLLCPSRHFVHSFLVPLHYATFAANPFASRPGIPSQTQSQHTWECTSLYTSQRYNTHWASFRFTTSYIHISSVQSTRCPCIACLLATVCVAGLLWHKPLPHGLMPMPRSAPSLCVHHSLRSLSCSPHPVAHAATSIRTSFQWLISARSAPTPHCRQVCGRAMLLFLPQALLPATQHTIPFASKKAGLNN